MLQQQLASKQGQSLLEVVVLIGLALVIVTGLTVVTVNGLKNSQFSQNQAQATRLAQDAIDCIRSIRDQNKPITIDATTYYWYDGSASNQIIWNAAPDPLSSSRTFGISTIGGLSCAGLQTAVTDTSIPASLQSTFVRTITLQSYNGIGQKKVSVLVTWVDISGSHSSSLATVIGEN